MSQPKHVLTVSLDQSVAIVFSLKGDPEGLLAGVEVEEDDTESKEVDDLALVRKSPQNFGRHVAIGAVIGGVDAGAVATLDWAGEAEVCNLDVVVLVEEDVLGLQVAVRETLAMDIVDALQHLLEVVLADGL